MSLNVREHRCAFSRCKTSPESGSRRFDKFRFCMRGNCKIKHNRVFSPYLRLKFAHRNDCSFQTNRIEACSLYSCADDLYVHHARRVCDLSLCGKIKSLLVEDEESRERVLNSAALRREYRLQTIGQAANDKDQCRRFHFRSAGKRARRLKRRVKS